MDRPAKNRKYTSDEKVVALTMYQVTQNLRETARKCNIPLGTLAAWVKGDSIKEDVPEKVESAARVLADTIEKTAWSILDSIDADTINAAPLGQRATAFGIFVDKTRLLRNETTSNEGGRQTVIVLPSNGRDN